MNKKPRDCRVRWIGWIEFWLLVWLWIAGPGLGRAGAVQGILREVWEGIPGTAVADLTNSPAFPNQPTSTNLVTDYFEAPVNVMDNYGQRMHGYVVPPVTGNYIFWIASDDQGELWLSTDDSPANRRLIAWVSGWTGSREWTKEPNQQSAPVRLEAGRAYYIAALQKEGWGGDNLAVRWLRPDGVDEGPIPARYLLPYGIALRTPEIMQQPTNTTVMEGQMAVFAVGLANPEMVTYRWQRNFVDLPGTQGPVLEYGPVRLLDHGAQFRVIASNSQGSVTSAVAVLMVTPDTVPPQLLGARNEGRTRVRVWFSEPMAVPGATNAAHYRLDRGRTVLSAQFGSSEAEVVLTTTELTYGERYTLTVSNLTDRAATPNPLPAGSQAVFTAYEFVPQDVGNPALAGDTVSVPGGVDVRGSGSGIGGTSDQFHFGWEEREGDFDLEVRVAGLTVPDPYVRAGLMARESLASNARFAAAFASSVQLGCFFQARSATGGVATVTAPRGGFPVNYPYTWLRLRRAGGVLTGYASLDGQVWTQLGSVTLSGLSNRLYVGFAVGSDTTNGVAYARFRDFGPTRSQLTGTVRLEREPVGPSSRTTGLIISEIMYHPTNRPDGRNLEFVELHNARSIFEELTGWRITGDIEYEFPDGFVLQAGETVVVAADPDSIRAVYGITNVLGPYRGSLPNDRGRVVLLNNAGAIRLAVEYSDQPPWPAAADGAGHSLVLARPSYGENDERAWAASELRGGSPGEMDPVVPAPEKAVVINEFLAHTDDPQLDFIELYNHSNVRVDLSGCVLTDDPTTNKFRIPDGTFIEPRGFLVWDQNQLGFALNAAGETIYLIASNGLRVLDAVRFGGQENGVSSGRTPDGSPWIRRLAWPTPGSANAPRRVEPVVINEIMYHPITENDDDEYIELHNAGGQPVDIGGWRFREGVEFTIPEGTVLGAGGYLVVARNVERLRSRYPQLNAGNSVGNYSGRLSNGGERLVLQKPDWVLRTNAMGEVSTNRIWITVGEVRYWDGGRWGFYADGGGSSLELVDPRADPMLPSSWADSDETAKAPWTTLVVTGRWDNANGNVAANRLYLGLLEAGECLVDDVEVLANGQNNVVVNGGFENGSTGWLFSGNHSTSLVVSTGAVSGASCLYVRASGDMDTGPNAIRTSLSSALAANATHVIRVKARWLAGSPQILLRVRGNGLELAGNMIVPSNLGTPGLPNSRRVANAGPAIYEVRHDPPLPDANEPVRVTCRVEDPDGVSLVRLRYRVDPSSTLTSVTMRDDGTGGDEVAGDGVYTAQLPGFSAGTLVAFRITATDRRGASSTFPAGAPAQECLIRWGDPVPFGTFAHYHLWFTAATASARTEGLDNTWRDSTLVYGNHRVIYNTGFRDKGSPYHGGRGDIAAKTPADEPLLGVQRRVFASTGNGGSEATGIRSQLAAWYAQQLGIPYLHAHYIRLYFNGSLFRPDIMEDLEEPNHDYAERWFPADGTGDLYKIAVWFEFQDNNRDFNATSATIERFVTLNNEYKLARYRWNWQRRTRDGDANNYRQFFDLVTAMNDTSTNYVPGILNLVDMEQWMRVLCFDFAMGNWDAWSYRVGQNMYLYRPRGGKWVLIPWDIDFTFGLGDGTTAALRGGHDNTMNRAYANPTFQRMNWRAYQDTINGPFRPERFQPQIDARRSILLKNGVTGLTHPSVITSWINARRAFIQSQLNAVDSPVLAITSNGGNNFTSTVPSVTLDGVAPIAVATLTVNGVPQPVTWTGVRTFRMTVPLTGVTNVLQVAGLDRLGRPVPGAETSITVYYTGEVPRPEDYVVINEIHYRPRPGEEGSAFLELYNRSMTASFDLSGYRLQGVGYTFPPGSVMPPGAYWVLVGNRARFEAVYGGGVPIFDVYPGGLDDNGERIALWRPGAEPGQEQLITDVRYSNAAPWPAHAAGGGSSLQLIDAAQGSWRVGNWWSPPTNHVNRTTPGRANAGVETLAPFPNVWINEVMPENLTGPADGAGDRDPWIELYNAGNEPVDLTGLHLTDDYGNLLKWAIPAGTTLAPKSFLVIWCDGEPGESRPGELHASFRLSPGTGRVALTRRQGAAQTPAVVDYLEYRQLSPDRSYGSYPDGEPRRRQPFVHVTPGAANNPEMPVIQVRINEFMASNTRTIADPADGDYDDWFELYNAGTNEVDLAGYYLTDNLLNPTKYRIPPGVKIPAGGFLLVWADEETHQNGQGPGLHVNFKLSASGEALGLFAPDGSVVDSFTFGPQKPDVSQGRYPDGADLPLVELSRPTPGAPNELEGGNRPPYFDPLPDLVVDEGTELRFVARAQDPDPGQTLRYELGDGAPSTASLDPATGEFRWTPDEKDGPGQYRFAIVARDDGSPSRSAVLWVNVTVREVNRPPRLAPIADVTVDEGTLLSLDLQADDPDWPPNRLTFALVSGPEGMTVSPGGALVWAVPAGTGDRTFAVTVEVADDGEPVLRDRTTFQVHVRDVPNPPEIPFIPLQQVDEGSVFELVVSAWDPDVPPAPLRFSLDVAPPGATIDPGTGRITWTTTEADGPANHVFVVRVTKDVPPFLSATRTFSVWVNEVNQPPRLLPLPVLHVREGQTFAMRALAEDDDRPAQTLRFDWATPPPGWIQLDAVSGWIYGTVPMDTGVTQAVAVVRVFDDGPGALSATQTCSLVIESRPHLVLHEIHYRPTQPGTEFVEIRNNSALRTEVLDDVWLLGSNLVYRFPAGTRLAPGAMALVVRNRTAFESYYGSGLPVVGTWTGTLGLTADRLQLARQTAGGKWEVLSEVAYEAALPWPQAANGGGASLQLVDATQDASRVANWEAVPPAPAQPWLLFTWTQPWRYDQSGVDLGEAWRAPGYDDSAWPSGPGLLYVEESGLPAPKSTPLTLGRMTYYFRTTFDHTGPVLGTRLIARLLVDDGAVVYLNGQEVLRVGLPTDVPVRYDTPANRTVGDATIETFELDSTYLRRGRNVVAAEVHQVNAGSSDIVWGMELELRPVAEPTTPGRTNSVATVLPPFPPLYLNEVGVINMTGPYDDAGEREPWVELYLAAPWPVTLDGWYLTHSVANLTRWAFPSGFTVPGFGLPLIWADGEVQESTPTSPHANFRLTQPGYVALVREQPGGPAVVDYIRIPALGVDQTYGSMPDGQGLNRSVLPEPTPGSPNAAIAAPRLEARLTPGGDGIEFVWPTQPGVRYVLQSTDDLGSPRWRDVADVVAPGDGMQFIEPRSAAQRYYRLVLP
ncbi:hypothetical protein G4L39_09915 [Limisphaera ngatamarikiensis]|uniref:Uncharacterized protein n=1 Tax=Limisphaera ngatamarikiensis TaxID=1324935 RepID=A0A6M1RIZ8_9BACT|nr:lamin tail domain-containing protein [Limisphaera ngatamarikiensis]NGO39706.1 hypothetical protein [Limisphaera ngatamarikiensis]